MYLIHLLPSPLHIELNWTIFIQLNFISSIIAFNNFWIQKIAFFAIFNYKLEVYNLKEHLPILCIFFMIKHWTFTECFSVHWAMGTNLWSFWLFVLYFFMFSPFIKSNASACTWFIFISHHIVKKYIRPLLFILSGLLSLNMKFCKLAMYFYFIYYFLHFLRRRIVKNKMCAYDKTQEQTNG